MRQTLSSIPDAWARIPPAPLRGVRPFLLLLCLFGAATLPCLALAHALAPSLLSLEETEAGLVEATWKTPLKRVPGSNLVPELPPHCRQLGEGRSRVEGTAAILHWTLDCSPEGLVGHEVGVTGIAGSRADVLLRVSLLDGRSYREVLNAQRSRARVPEQQSRLSVMRSYLVMGAEHLLGGADHVLFVLALFGIVGWGRSLFWTITSFTVGHSLTLSLATLGVVRFPSGLAEALIAFSIVLAAVELARPERAGLLRRRPWFMALGFGLLHGLGFAGALSEVGLPAGEIPMALFSFNVGIELGQLALIAVAAAVALAWRRWAIPLPLPARVVAAYGIGSLAAYWMWERLAAIPGV